MHPGSPNIDELSLLIGGQTSLRDGTSFMYIVAGLSAIGGFLFGYDTGITSGALIYIRDVFGLNELWQEFIVSSTLLAAWIASIVSGPATEKLGRKPVIISASLVFAFGSILMGLAHSKFVLLIGRLIVGTGVGFASMTVPMYIAEIAPAGIRGRLVTINMCCVTGGQFIAAVVAYLFSFANDGQEWRYMLGVAAIPAIIQFFAFIRMPESPRWLIINRRYEEAKQVLRRVRPGEMDIEAEFAAIRESYVKSQDERRSLEDITKGQSTFKLIMANQPVRKALIVGCVLQLVQQISGINTVMYYTATIFQMSGVYSKQKALLLSTGAAFVNFAFTVIGFTLVEKVGRRKLTLCSVFGVIIGLLILAGGFQVAYYNSPLVTGHNHSALSLPCSSYSDCSSCSSDSGCGFCFSTPDNNMVTKKALCLNTNPQEPDHSTVGQLCVNGSDDVYIWAYGWCPSSYAMLIMIGMIFYLACFAHGLGPMPWTINAEIFPLWARSWCQSASTSVCWSFNLLISMTFLSLTRAITKQGAFYLYAACSTLGFIYFLFHLPETRGKSLEDMEDIFASKSWLEKRREQNEKKLLQNIEATVK